MEIDLLRAVLDRIIPRDACPSASDAGVDLFVMNLWQGGEPSGEDVARGLQRLDEACLSRFSCAFAMLAGQDQDDMIGKIAAEPWFHALCELAAEGYYADPANGANPACLSWDMIGYRPGLPDGVDGPPRDPRDAALGRFPP